MKPAEFVPKMNQRMTELLQQRHALGREDLEYVAIAIEKLKDARLRGCIADLIGWGDEERAEVETFVAIALEVFKTVNPSKLRSAARVVEIRSLIKEKNT